jgi:anthranilate synthase component 1
MRGYIETVDQPVDPFYAYVELTAQLGEGQAFLLDAGADTGSPYAMSLVGVVPLLEVQAKNRQVNLQVWPDLVHRLTDDLRLRGYVAAPEATEISPSVLDGVTLSFTPDDPMALLEAVRSVLAQWLGVQSTPFAAGFLGYIGYDAVRYLESIPCTTDDDRGLPDVRLQWHAVVLKFDRGRMEMTDCVAELAPYLSAASREELDRRVDTVRRCVGAWRSKAPSADVMTAVIGGEPETARTVKMGAQQTVHEDTSQSEYEQAVRRALAYIRAGDIFQVVLSRRIRIDKQVHHYLAYDALRRLNPSPYMFMVEYPSYRLFGASPEVQFRALEGVAEMKPIAGTSKGRGRSREEDEALQARLLADEKERAEHVMLVDLCRNDLGRVCAIGSVEVRELMEVEAYSHVLHLVSTVRGRLRDDVSVFHALLATFPAGTLSGAPKIRAMEIIDELESRCRGPYGGMIGVIDFAGNANMAIFIRSVIEYAGEFHVQVGAGIVADSDPSEEWLECGRKAGAMLDVLTGRRGLLRV